MAAVRPKRRNDRAEPDHWWSGGLEDSVSVVSEAEWLLCALNAATTGPSPMRGPVGLVNT